MMKAKQYQIGRLHFVFMYDVAQWWIGVSFQNDQVAPAVVIQPLPCLSLWVWWTKHAS